MVGFNLELLFSSQEMLLNMGMATLWTQSEILKRRPRTTEVVTVTMHLLKNAISNSILYYLHLYINDKTLNN